MSIWTGKIMLAAIVVYVLASLASAVRMYFIHGRYVHVEFDKKKWAAFGDWAPRRIATLVFIQKIALILIIIWVISIAIDISRATP